MADQVNPGITLTIPGGVSYSYDFTFLAAVVLAVLVVILFSISKFEESTIEKNDDELLSQLLPRYMSTPEEYTRALLAYVTAMSLIVVALSFLGPRVINLGATNMPESPSALPLFIALVLVGVLPNVPWLQQIEWRLRRFAHERAFIPKAARASAERLAAAEFDYAAYQAPKILRSSSMRGVEVDDFSASRDSIEYAWARLSCLLYRVKYWQDLGLGGPLDVEVLERYAKDIENIALKRRSMEDDIAQYRKAKLDNPYYGDDELHASIWKTLRSLYILLGCAVRLKLDDDTEMNPALKAFGFKFGSVSSPQTHKNVMVVGLAVMWVSIFLIVYAAIGIGSLNLWGRSSLFPQAPFEAFVWSFSAVLAHGSAIATAEWVRSRRVARGRWFARGPVKRRTAANYIFVAVACAITGFVALFGLSVLLVTPSLDLAKSLLSYSLLPAASGAFYVLHLDNVDLAHRPQRKVEIATQALVTGFCGFVAATISLGFMQIGLAAALDYVSLIAVFGIVVGASLAWYIPAAVASSKYDPLADALAVRVSALKAEALRSLGSAELADGWVERPNPSLNNQSPRAASTDIVQFEKAMGLLQNAPAPVLVGAGARPN